MNEGLDQAISEKQRDKLIRWINELYDQEALKERDLINILHLFSDICAREAAESYEQYLINSFNEDDAE